MSVRPAARSYTPIRVVILLVAVLCFALATFSVSVPINLVDLGLALFAASFLVPWVDV
jgi:hypothetical protein